LKVYGNEVLGTDHDSVLDLAPQLDIFFSIDDDRPNEAAIPCFGIRPHKFFPNATSMFSAGDRTSSLFKRSSIEGPLVRQLQELVHLTLSNINRTASFSDPAIRNDETEIPAEVIREVIANAIAHRDFDRDGRVHPCR
jgi:predicted HTH transcriptional regulator